MNNSPDHRSQAAAETSQIPRINGHAQPKRREQKPVPIVVYLAVVIALGAIAWGTWESGLHQSIKIVVTGLCTALVLLTASSGIEFRRGSR